MTQIITQNERLNPDTTVFVEDGNALFQSLVQIPPTFSEIALKLLSDLGQNKKHIISKNCSISFIIGNNKFLLI